MCVLIMYGCTFAARDERKERMNEWSPERMNTRALIKLETMDVVIDKHINQ